MADVVIVLGAGCSRDAGAPLMNGFLDRARELFDSGQVDDWREDFDLVFRAIGRLSAVHSKAMLDVVNLEAVFNSFEMATQLRKFPHLTAEEIERLVPALKIVIVRTLELTMQFPVRGGVPGAPSGYAELAKLVRSAIRERKPSLSFAFISFNYDVGLDVALAGERLQFTYALNESGEHGVPLLKLHGSLNWIKEGDSIKVLDVQKMLHPRHFFPGDAPDAMSMEISRKHPDVSQHAHSPLPFIVPPTMSKGEYHRQIVPVWRRAAVELGGARHLVVCGYSMPNTDEFFKVLYALGSEGPQPLRTFTVLDIDKAVHDRVRAILGPGAAQRFQPATGVFASLASVLRETLQVP